MLGNEGKTEEILKVSGLYYNAWKSQPRIFLHEEI